MVSGVVVDYAYFCMLKILILIFIVVIASLFEYRVRKHNQGPVRPTDNEMLFRLTGITSKKGV